MICPSEEEAHSKSRLKAWRKTKGIGMKGTKGRHPSKVGKNPTSIKEAKIMVMLVISSVFSEGISHKKRTRRRTN